MVETDEIVVVTIVGEPGIGKTRLLEAAARGARSGVRPLIGVGDPILANSSYHGWQTIVQDLLGLGPVASLAERQEAVSRFLTTLPGLDDLAPVLDPILELGLEETAASANLSRSGRRAVIATVVSELLERAAADQPLMLVFDDAHWLDAASLALLEEALPTRGPVMVVLATRDESMRGAMLPRFEGATSVTVRPQSLTPDEAVELAMQTLGVSDLPGDVAAAIADRTAGNPLLIEQLAIAIREAQSDGADRPVQVPPELQVPNSVHGLVASRIDHLGPAAGLVVRTASALGRSFSSGLLSTALGRSVIDDVDDAIEELVMANLFSVRLDGWYAFRHALIQEAVYDMLPEAQRRAIHATAYQVLLESASRQPALLAYHAERAGFIAQALDHLEAAGTDAVRRAANQEAINLFTRALSLAGDPQPRPSRRAYWHSQLGIAYMDVGELERSHEEHLRALAELRIRVPRYRVGVVARSVGEAVLQAGHYVSSHVRSRRRSPPSDQAYRLALAARVCSLIGEIHYFRADSLRFVLFNLMSINLAERSGHVAAGGLAYSSLSYLARVLRFRRVADAYNRASAMAEELKAASEADGLDHRQVAMLPPHGVVAGGSRGSYQMCFAEWDAALASFDSAAEACRVRHDSYQLEIIQALRGQALALSRTLGEACDEFRALHASSVERHNPEHLAWALALGTSLLFESGAAGEARRWAGEIEQAIPVADPATWPILHAVWAEASLRAGHPALALEQAMTGLSHMSASPIFPQLFGYTAALGVIYSLWAEGSELVTRSVRRAERAALRRLRVFALTLPFGRPRVALLRGQALAVRGRPRRACRRWQRGIDRAHRQGQRWDEARMWELIGRHCPDRADDARLRARELYAAVGAHESLERLAGAG